MRQQGGVLLMSVIVLATVSLLLITVLQSQKHFLWLLNAQQQRSTHFERAENSLNQLIYHNRELFMQEFQQSQVACFNMENTRCDHELIYPETGQDYTLSAYAEYEVQDSINTYWKLRLQYQGEQALELEVVLNANTRSQWLYYD